MKILKLIILFLFLPISVVLGQKLNLTVAEIFTLGGEENPSEEYLFVNPQQIFTDTKNNIYLRDVWTTNGDHSDEIKKYSSKGKYIATIGQKGNGPGEFQRIICFCIKKNDDILLYDEINHRVTIFNTNCVDYKILKNYSNVYFKPRYISPFTAESYLVINYEILNELENVKLFSIYSDNFSEIYEKFGDPNDIWDQSTVFSKRQSRLKRINTAVVDSTTIFAVPEYYEGKIYRFYKTDNNWHTQKLTGIKPKLKAYKKLPISSVESIRKYMNSGKKIKPFMGFGEKGKGYCYQYHNKSAGIFTYLNNYVIHFSVLDNDDGKYHFVAELFSNKGVFLGYKIIEKDRTKIYLEVIGQDQAGHFFISEQINEIPAIKKISTKYIFNKPER